MGNRAVITIKPDGTKDYSNQIGIYLHWNGGRDSIEAFLKYCELKSYRSPSEDNYGMARLTQVIANFLGGTTSIGVDIAKNLDCDNMDNGVYLVKGWEIVDRDHFKGTEQKTYPLIDMLIDIDKTQPVIEQIGEERIKELVK